jgi:phosphoglycolate phosphatase
MPTESRLHILLDLDGTLVDSVDGIHAACVVAAKEVDRAVPSRELVLRSIGRGADRLLHRILRGDHETELTPVMHQRARAIFDREYREACLDGTVLRAGVAESLDQLRRIGHRLWIATNKPRVPATRVIDRLGLDEMVDGLCCPEDAGVLKPDPRFIEVVLGLDGGASNRAMLVGDSSVDAQTAENAGIPFIAIRGGYDEGRDIGHRVPPPDVVIESPADLPRAIAELATSSRNEDPTS